MKCDFCGLEVTGAGVEVVIRISRQATTLETVARGAHIPCVLSALDTSIWPQPWTPMVASIDNMPALKQLRAPRLRVV